MKTTTRIVTTLLIIVTGLSTAPIAQAQASPSVEGGKAFPASSPLVIPAAAFSTKGNDASSHEMVWWEGYVRGTSSTGGCVQAPVYLPRFARITNFWISFVDDDASNDFSVWFTRTSNFTPNEADDIVSVTTSGVSTSVRVLSNSTISHPIVIHPDYSYFVSVCLPTQSTKLYSARIYHHDDVLFADGFETGGSSSWAEVQP